MPIFKAVFPCGHEHTQESSHMKGRKCCGKRPIELHIDGVMSIEDLVWHKPILHPLLGKMYHNGELVYGTD